MKWRIELTEREIDEPRAEIAIFLPVVFLPFIVLSAMRALSVATSPVYSVVDRHL